MMKAYILIVMTLVQDVGPVQTQSAPIVSLAECTAKKLAAINAAGDRIIHAECKETSVAQ